MAREFLITGGAGFIGCNAAFHFLQRGDRITIFDNLSRRGAESNLRWLQKIGEVSFVKGDVRDYHALEQLFAQKQFDVVLHLAAQVAVTSSVLNPRQDFEINAVGTFNLLEAIRNTRSNPILLFTSTNKVYGNLEGVPISNVNGRYVFPTRPKGISESTIVDFHSPYGCSKGAADQYVRDYARIYDLRSVVFRMSCIYGSRQFGVEDQGWVAWFTICAETGRCVTVYGDGMQVRDVLYVDDLMRAFDLAINRIDIAGGKTYNIGGGPDQQMSLLELIALLEKLKGTKIQPVFDDWRPGDQRVYISDISRIAMELGWEPKISPEEGVERLQRWVAGHLDLVKSAGII